MLATLAKHTDTIARERSPVLKGLLRIRRYNQQETPYAPQEEELTLLASVRRGLLGFAGLAPHSGRSSVPFRRTLFWDRRLLPFQLKRLQTAGAAPRRVKTALTNEEV